MALGLRHDDTELDRLDELQTTAERVERFRLMHEDAVRDLRHNDRAGPRRGLRARTTSTHAIRRARDSVGRFSRLPDAGV